MKELHLSKKVDWRQNNRKKEKRKEHKGKLHQKSLREFQTTHQRRNLQTHALQGKCPSYLQVCLTWQAEFLIPTMMASPIPHTTR